MPAPKHLFPKKPSRKKNPLGTGGTLLVIGGVALVSLAAVGTTVWWFANNVKPTNGGKGTGDGNGKPDDWGVIGEFQDEMNEGGLPLRLYRDKPSGEYFAVFSWRMSRGATGPLLLWYQAANLPGDAVETMLYQSPADAVQRAKELIDSMLAFANSGAVQPEHYPYPLAFVDVKYFYGDFCYKGVLPATDYDEAANLYILTDKFQPIVREGPAHFMHGFKSTLPEAAQVVQDSPVNCM